MCFVRFIRFIMVRGEPMRVGWNVNAHRWMLPVMILFGYLLAFGSAGAVTPHPAFATQGECMFNGDLHPVYNGGLSDNAFFHRFQTRNNTLHSPAAFANRDNLESVLAARHPSCLPTNPLHTLIPEPYTFICLLLSFHFSMATSRIRLLFGWKLPVQSG